ncbi:MAG TPA: TonB-dependent receptor, partial [Sphingomonas sp.]|nr:TonB-dependent receptor [Sphingomonas sp.]
MVHLLRIDLSLRSSLNCIALTLLSTSAALLSTSAAHAQADPRPPQDAGTTPSPTAALPEGEDDSIVVTGSRIYRAEIDSPTPLVSYSEADIALSGRVNLTDFLAQNPALLGSVTSVRSSGTAASSGATGVNLLNLRNLGTQRTLVLVDGRRHVAGLPGTAAVDVSTIPTDLVERVDVTTGAASAIYGADAVSGVVNFALKRNFAGLTARAQNGVSEYGDGGSRLVAVTAGKNFADDRGNIALAYEFRDTDRVSTADRARSGDPLKTYSFVPNPDDVADDPTRYDDVLRNDIRWADSSRDGAIDLDGDGVPDFTGSGKVYDRGTILDGGVTQGGDGTPLAGYDGDEQAANRVHNVNLLTSFQVTPSIRVFAQGKFVDTRSATESQPNYDFYTYLAADNAYLNDRFGVDASANGALLTRDHFDLGLRGDESSRQTYRSVIGFDGDLGGAAKFEASYVHGRTDRTSVSTNNLVSDRYYAALDAVRDDNGTIVCRSDLDPDAVIDANNYGERATTFTPGANSGCKPLNLLGEGVASAEAIDFVTADVTRKSRVLQHVLSGSINGDLGGFLQMPGGAIGYAFGGEYRAESSRYQPDELSKQGMLINSTREADEYGSFDVKEVFGELRVPIARGARFFETLELNAALRLSDYSTVGATTTWQVSGIWAPVRDVRFRATYSQAVRAPNISELFAPSSGTFGRVN